jgi:hypothetical protein
MIELEPKAEASHDFEITIAVRNALGELTGTKSYGTDDAADLCAWYEKNAHRRIPKRKHNKNKNKNKKQGRGGASAEN